MFNLAALNPSQRFNWPESRQVDADGNETYAEWVELKVPSANDMEGIRKKLGLKEKIVNVVNPETRAVNQVVGTNLYDDGARRSKDFDDEIIDCYIVAWRLLTETGDDIACTRANKIMLVRGSPVFAKFVTDGLETMRKGQAALVEAEIKN